MSSKKALTTISIFLTTTVVVFIAGTLVFGIPLWWTLRDLREFSIIQLPRIIVSVVPETPLNIGEEILITVYNSSSRLPLMGAKVSVIKDGSTLIDLYTNAQGEVSFEYPGEITIIRVEMSGFDPIMKAIPKAPDKWMRETWISMVIGIATGFTSAIFISILKRSSSVGKR